MSKVDVKASSTSAPGLRLVLLAISIVMALTADMPIASAAPGGAGQDLAPAPAAEPADGRLGTRTWRSLLHFDPVRPRWAGRRAKRGGGATASRALPPRRPRSASLPATADEIDPGPAP